jgi:hypothetical protein
MAYLEITGINSYPGDRLQWTVFVLNYKKLGSFAPKGRQKSVLVS